MIFKKLFLVVGGSAVVVMVFLVTINYLPKLSSLLQGVRPLITKGPDITKPLPGAINQTGLPLNIPDGLEISIFAKDLEGARGMAFDGFGNLWVSQTSEGAVSMLEIRDNKVIKQERVFRNLNRPHGLAFDPEEPFTLYIAEEDKISRVHLYSEEPLQKIVDLPKGGRHFTRTIGFGPDGRLYVSIGSSCDVCEESDSRRAAIYSVNKDGSDFREYASGLRNSVFFAWHPKTQKLWATEMGRDNLGDDLPPDEINLVEYGKNYGWPICFGKNIHDTNFDKNTYIRNPCGEPDTIGSFIDLQAHSAPLGLSFVPQHIWPEEYDGDLLVAFHGSWNRSEPTGYKIVQIKFDTQGKFISTEDFITGWLAENVALGRPVDLKFHSGNLYISDDRAGVIYVVRAITEKASVILDTNIAVEKIQSPLRITGKALGSLYFEASFPVELRDAEGNVLAKAPAQALGNWMSRDYVFFSLDLEFIKPQTETGIMIFRKDNPSGFSEHDEELIIPVRFR